MMNRPTYPNLKQRFLLVLLFFGSFELCQRGDMRHVQNFVCLSFIFIAVGFS